MAQFNWIYVTDYGKRYNIGLFHGPRTGHVMVHCNAKVVLIDFHVLEDKSYPLFIEDELFELRIKRENGHFEYGLDINKKADTPRNRERHQQERKYWWQTLAFLGILVVFVGGFFLFWQSRESRGEDVAAILERTGREAIARVTATETAEPVSYSFVANGRGYQGQTEHPGSLPGHGLPLESGDEFIVRYAGRAPRINEIDFSRPTEQQLERYLDRTLERHARLHPELRPEQAECQVSLAYEQQGLDGLADLYFQDTPSAKNPDHNRQSYLRLIRSVPFRQAAREQCW